MLWKVFSGLAAIALGIGVYFSIQTKDAIRSEKELEKRAVDNLDTLKSKQKEGADIKAKREKDLEDRKTELAGVKTELTKVTTETDQKTAEVDIIKKSLEEVQKQVVALEDQINKAGNIKQLMAQVAELNKQKVTAVGMIANQQQQLALADADVAKVAAEINRLEEVDKRQRAGVVEPGFTARITQPYQNFGFVILNKGNLGGMFANAMLDVKRGSRVVARLKVRDVEQAMSVADLVPGTMAQGETIRSGDLVVAAKLPTPPPTPAPDAAGAATTTTPAPGATMAPPTPAAPAPPAAADPFGAPAGGMAPAAPAPAPGAPAPAADPFAQPPAGGAPAPAAPSAPGTPAAPGTDPFAPAPPPGGAPPPAPAAPPAPN